MHIFSFVVAGGRTKVGLLDMAAFQLLWARLYCLCSYWEGNTMKFLVHCFKMIKVGPTDDHPQQYSQGALMTLY